MHSGENKLPSGDMRCKPLSIPNVVCERANIPFTLRKSPRSTACADWPEKSNGRASSKPRDSLRVAFCGVDCSAALQSTCLLHARARGVTAGLTGWNTLHCLLISAMISSRRDVKAMDERCWGLQAQRYRQTICELLCQDTEHQTKIANLSFSFPRQISRLTVLKSVFQNEQHCGLPCCGLPCQPHE